MAEDTKRKQILDALQRLLDQKNIQSISVNEIAQEAQMGKSSIYYYFRTKEEILEALIERNYKEPLAVIGNLVDQREVSVFARMAKMFQVCKESALMFARESSQQISIAPSELALLREKCIKYLIAELKPQLTALIQQGIEGGEMEFAYPEAMAEIALIVLTVKMDNTLSPSMQEGMDETMRGLVALLEKGTNSAKGTFDFLSVF